jgi:hypothetical protein
MPAGTFLVERVGRRTLLAAGGAVIVTTLTILTALLASQPTAAQASGTSATASPSVLLTVALVLLCLNRVALTCTLQPLAATGESGGLPYSLVMIGPGQNFGQKKPSNRPTVQPSNRPIFVF